MKKIISVLAFFAVLVLGVNRASADGAIFNYPGSMPTITVTDGTTNPCNYGVVNGCWKTSASARPGDTVSVQVYYKNTSNTPATGTTVHIGPGTISGSVNSVTFSGGVVSTNSPRATGSATISISSSQTLTYVPGTARWARNDQAGIQSIDASALFGSGFNVGTINPGQQGVVAVDFKVSGNVTQPSCTLNLTANPTSITKGNSSVLSWTSSNCTNLSLSGVGSVGASGSKTVYPSQTTTYTLTGYSQNGQAVTDTATVTVTQVQQNYCTLNLSANPTSIQEGNSSVLSWTSSNCTNLTLSGYGSVSSSGSTTVYPSTTTTYTLTGYSSNGQAVTDSVTVYVNQIQQQQCYVNSFTADNTSITQGDTTTLRWSTTGVNSVDISPNYSNQSSNGSVSVAPYQTTTYSLTAYCQNGSTQSASTTIYVNSNIPPVQTGTAPQAITTTATILSTSQARLNGIAVPNSNVITYAWFDWGPTQDLPYHSSKQTITNSGSTYFNDVAGNLIPGHTYYYRAAAQNQYGTSYGTIVPFQTQGAVASTTTVVKYVPQVVTTSTAIVAKSAPSLLELTVESSYDHMCVGGSIDYHVSFKNISTTQTLQNAVLRITLPPEVDYVASSQGTFNPLDRSLTVVLGNVPPQATGEVDLHGTVNNAAVVGKIAVTTATVVYTNTVTHAQEDAIAYSIVTITNECPSLLGASVFGFSFLPHTLLGWLALILVILALIVLARQIGKKPQPIA